MYQEIELLQYIIEQIVEDKDAIQIDRTEDEKGVLLTLSVSQNDMGRIIGKSGQVIQSIKTLLKLIGAKSGNRVYLRVNEPK